MFDEAIDKVQLTASELRDFVGKTFHEGEYITRAIAEDVSMCIEKGYHNREQIKDKIASFVTKHPKMIGIGIAFSENGFDSVDHQYAGGLPGHDETGRFLPYYTLDATGIPIIDPMYAYVHDEPDNYYHVPMRTLRPHVTDVYESLVLSDTVFMLTISYPVFNQGKFAGVTITDYDLTEVEEWLTKYTLFDGQGSAALISTLGHYIAHSTHREWRGKSVEKVSPEIRPTTEETKRLHANENVLRIDDKDITVFFPIFVAEHSIPLILYVSLPRSVAMADANRMWALTAGFAIAITILGSFLIIYSLRRMLRPIAMITKRTEKIAEGDLSQTGTMTMMRGELGRLTNSVDSMVENLRSMINTTRDVSISIDDVSKQTNKLSESIQGGVQATKEQVEIGQAIGTEMTETGRTTLSLTSKSADLIKEVNTRLHNLRKLSTQSADSQERIFRQVAEVAEVAAQTDILALNAAIEAARAGAAGRGFSVVAEEVRKLAVRSSEMASSIMTLSQQSLNDSKNAAEHVVDIAPLIEECVTNMEEVAKITAHLTTSITNMEVAYERIDKTSATNQELSSVFAENAKNLIVQTDKLREFIARFRY